MQLLHGAFRRTLVIVLSLVVLLGSVTVGDASPRSVIRLTKKRLARTRAAITRRNKEMRRVRKQLARMDVTFALTVEKYNGIRIELRKTDRQVSVNLARLREAISDLNDARDLLNERVVNIYKQGKATTVDVFVNVNGFDDFLTSLDLLTFIADADKDMVVRVGRTKERIKDVQEDLLAKRRRQKVLQAEVAAQKARVGQQIVERRRYIGKLGRDIRALLARGRAQEARIAAEQARLARLAAAAAARRSGGSNAGTGWFRGAIGRGGRQDVVRAAMRLLGVPYVWGGESPSGVDCSGLVLLAYRAVGVELPHKASYQYGYGRSVSRGSLLPGDLVFFSRGGAEDIYHVAIYVGNGNIIEAPYTGASVWIKSLDAKSNYFGAKRLL